MKLWKCQRPVQGFRELSQARQPVGGVDLDVEGCQRCRQRQVQPRTHRHTDGGAEERSQLDSRSPFAGLDQTCQHIAQFFRLDLSERARGQLREGSAEAQLEDRLRVVGLDFSLAVGAILLGVATILPLRRRLRS